MMPSQFFRVVLGFRAQTDIQKINDIYSAHIVEHFSIHHIREWRQKLWLKNGWGERTTCHLKTSLENGLKFVRKAPRIMKFRVKTPWTIS